jgi:hypothetical protein
VTASEEHIVLDSLGGRLVSPDLLDKTTNDRFGSTVDAALADVLLPIRVMLDAKAADGRSAPFFRGATTADGRRYNVLPGGKPELAAPEVQIALTEKGVAINAKVRSMSEARRLLERKLSEYGIRPEVLEAAARGVEEHVPMLNFGLEFGPGAWRAILKMACNLLAHRQAPLFLGAGFDAVRNLVLTGVGDPWDFVAFNTASVDLNAQGSALGQLDHLVLVHGDATACSVHGLVALYGHLQFVLFLGSAPLDASFATSYRVDQLGGTDRLDAPEDGEIVPPPFKRYSESEFASWC